VSVEEYRQQSLETWEAMASGWENRVAEIDEVGAPVLEWLIAALAPGQGDVVLELAAGPGSTGLAASPLVGDGGRVISTDFSPAMVEVARRRAETLGVTNVEHVVMDAGELGLEDGSVDGVICRWGYMLMPDPVAAFAETRRVLRSGGRLAFAVWRGPEQNPWVSLAGRMLVERGLFPPPEPGAPGMFSLGEDARLRELLDGAGFAIERLEDVEAHFRYEDVDDYIVTARDTGGQFARAWDGASDEQRDAMTAELEERFAPFRSEDGYAMTGVAACVLAS
jgi:ubiquinone/menaquinone biosynthesis C-methylase UbiE